MNLANIGLAQKFSKLWVIKLIIIVFSMHIVKASTVETEMRGKKLVGQNIRVRSTKALDKNCKKLCIIIYFVKCNQNNFA